jgi:hypothetical protein
MEPVTIHIATNQRFVRIFALLAKLVGGGYSVEPVKPQNLHSVIEQAEKDFTEGKGTIMTLDELRALTNEVA